MTKKISDELLMKIVISCIFIPICSLIIVISMGMIFSIEPDVIIKLIPKPMIGIWMLVSVIVVSAILLKKS